MTQNQSINSNARRRRGITLVELLVVIFIIALLITLFLPSTGHPPHLRRQSACKSNLNAIGKGFKLYEATEEELPLLMEDGDYTAAATKANLANELWGEDGKSRIGQGAMQNAWILVASGVVGEKVFICPSDKACKERDENLPKYGWTSDDQYSYGLHAPYAKYKGTDNPAHWNPELKGSMPLFSDYHQAGKSPNHKKDGVSYLMFNGSVQWFKKRDFTENGVPAGPSGDDIFSTQNKDNPHLPANDKDCYIVPRP